MHEQRDRIVLIVQKARGRVLLDPERHRALHVLRVSPDDPADPRPAFALKRIVRIARLVGKAVMLRVIIHPVCHFALHGEGQIKRHDHTPEPGNLARFMLPDPMHGPDPQIAQEYRKPCHA